MSHLNFYQLYQIIFVQDNFSSEASLRPLHLVFTMSAPLEEPIELWKSLRAILQYPLTQGLERPRLTFLKIEKRGISFLALSLSRRHYKPKSFL
jgi:hypothetical protein